MVHKFCFMTMCKDSGTRNKMSWKILNVNFSYFNQVKVNMSFVLFLVVLVPSKIVPQKSIRWPKNFRVKLETKHKLKSDLNNL